MLFEYLRSLSLKSKLTIRYALALALIAIILIGSYALMYNQLQQNKKDAFIVNVSGMQRMLLQRIALMARELHDAQSAGAEAMYFQELQTVRKTMLSNHEMLTQGILGSGEYYGMSPEIEEMYFGDLDVDGRVRTYLDQARQLIQIFEDQGVSGVRSSELVEQIVSTAHTGLLSDLNAVVFQYQAQAEANVGRFQLIEAVIICLGLALLVIEVLFIFRPMVRSIVRIVRDLEQTNNELVEFTYRISHDLRAPVVSSLGLVEASKVALDKPEIVSQAIGYIENSMIRLQDLIEDILNLTRLKLTDVEEEPVEFSEMLDDTLAKLEHMERFSDIVIEKDIVLKKPIVTKRLFLEQTLANLISNAIKYSDPEKPQSIIQISACKKGAQFCIRVSDNGLEIPEEYRSQVFEMFKRFHPEASFGSGLGLYLVQRNVQNLGGEIEYIPLSDGSAFEFCFN